MKSIFSNAFFSVEAFTAFSNREACTSFRFSQDDVLFHELFRQGRAGIAWLESSIEVESDGFPGAETPQSAYPNDFPRLVRILAERLIRPKR